MDKPDGQMEAAAVVVEVVVRVMVVRLMVAGAGRTGWTDEYATVQWT